MTRSSFLTSILLCLVAALLPGCDGDGASEHDHDGDGKTSHAAHRHTAHPHIAPHGGALVEFDAEFAHLEFVLGPEQGSLTAFALGAHAETPVRLTQETILVEIVCAAGAFVVELAAVDNPLSGETAGDTSQFTVTDERLRGVDQFTGVVKQVTLKGAEFKNRSFRYPEGATAE